MTAPSPPARARYLAQRIEYWNDFAGNFRQWERFRRAYQGRLTDIYRLLVPAGARVLEIGCGTGDLLAALKPSRGAGVDFAGRMIELARERHPALEFIHADAHDFKLSESFDYIVLSDLVNELWDVQAVLETARRYCHADTRIIVNMYSRLWEAPRRVGEALGVVKPQLPQNWLTLGDVSNLMYLAGLEVIRHSQEIAWPVRTPLVETIANRFLVKLWPLRHLGITNVVIARPQPSSPREGRVSVVIPARNEAGNIRAAFERTPEMGLGTELIFVEGGSRDDTYASIEREIAARPGVRAKLLKQPGKGKGDAVRTGFAESTGDLLMILDADLTVAPEDLPRFYEAWRSGKADFVNGVRLVYPMQDRAMRFFNLLGNKFFSTGYTWLLGQTVKDTLCGTKVLSRQHYEVIAANRAYFGDIDPFGDFDLLFGAARYCLKIVDVPVRYHERTYGETNIRRWSEGWLLLRMMARAAGKLKFV